jgi:hypothetical protein
MKTYSPNSITCSEIGRTGYLRPSRLHHCRIFCSLADSFLKQKKCTRQNADSDGTSNTIRMESLPGRTAPTHRSSGMRCCLRGGISSVSFHLPSTITSVCGSIAYVRAELLLIPISTQRTPATSFVPVAKTSKGDCDAERKRRTNANPSSATKPRRSFHRALRNCAAESMESLGHDKVRFEVSWIWITQAQQRKEIDQKTLQVARAVIRIADQLPFFMPSVCRVRHTQCSTAFGRQFQRGRNYAVAEKDCFVVDDRSEVHGKMPAGMVRNRHCSAWHSGRISPSDHSNGDEATQRTREQQSERQQRKDREGGDGPPFEPANAFLHACDFRRGDGGEAITKGRKGIKVGRSVPLSRGYIDLRARLGRELAHFARLVRPFGPLRMAQIPSEAEVSPYLPRNATGLRSQQVRKEFRREYYSMHPFASWLLLAGTSRAPDAKTEQIQLCGCAPFVFQ